jgi:hypothetical protein
LSYEFDCEYNCALAKNGSLGFARGRLVCGVKPNVLFVLLANIVFKKCEVEKTKKYRIVGFCLGCSDGSFFQSLYVYFFCSFFLCRSLGLQVISLHPKKLRVVLFYRSDPKTITWYLHSQK